MTRSEMRSKIDSLWLSFHTGGVTNPITVIEQISYLIFSRLLDTTESRNEKKASRSGEPFKAIFTKDEQELRWSQFKTLSGAEMLPLVRDNVFKHFQSVEHYGDFMRDAQLMVQKPQLLVQAVNVVDELPITSGDHKGDLYEYLLSKLSTAGIAGQFRTPRHIIQNIVELMNPQPMETVCDPSCGTAGFLVEALHHVLKQHTSKEGVLKTNEDENPFYTGDLLKPEHRANINNGFLNGFDFDATMLRVSAMNMLLHGVEEPNIFYQDTLSYTFPDNQPKRCSDYFDLILANPPFKGSLDYDMVNPSLIKKVKTKKTELLFVQLILQMLKVGGRAAVIVPDGVLFGSTKAHVALRKALVEENQLEAVISLPSGVFKPYAGVSTGILVFTKGGTTEDVFYYDVQQDGYSLDDKRDKIKENDLPDLLARWESKDSQKDTDRTGKAFFVFADELRSNNYDLSLQNYKQIKYVPTKTRNPTDILFDMEKIEKEIISDLQDIRNLL